MGEGRRMGGTSKGSNDTLQVRNNTDSENGAKRMEVREIWELEWGAPGNYWL